MSEPALESYRFAEIAVPAPLRHTFTYRIPDALRGRVRPGSVVKAPFGRRRVEGFVVRLADAAPVADLKDITDVEPEDFTLPSDILRLGEWVADYYLAPIGEVLRAALPAGLGRKSPGDVPESAGAAPDLVLNPEQQAAFDEIVRGLDGGAFVSYLLHGVTGSGKTEVYLRAAAEAVRRGGRALILLPEIALSPQMVSRVEARFGHRVALWHSALTPARRRQVWTRTRRGEVDVLVGARSAVFAPIPDLKLVVVDEEHESTYKQTESPRYHARDVALVRARMAGAAVILGSATPSLESYANAERGKYRILVLPHRVRERAHGRVEVVEIPRAEPGKRRPISLVLSDALRNALNETLSRGEQSILFLNRRGHSTVVTCESCRTPVSCAQCDIVLTYHAAGDRLQCHYCGETRERPAACPECGEGLMLYKGTGTQKVEGELRRLYPGARVLRLDTDTARRRGVLETTLETFRRGDAEILLGTQMVAKGLDFPDVTLVGVVNADTQLHLPDFRSAERTFQLLTQVAGRSGRGDRPGRVIIQTSKPDHYAVAAAARLDYVAFYRQEMRDRGELNYPPYHRLVNLLFDGASETTVTAEAEAIGALLVARIEKDGAEVALLGPAPQPISRLKGKHRWHVTLRGPDPKRLHALADLALRDHAERKSRVRLSVDVDPVSLL